MSINRDEKGLALIESLLALGLLGLVLSGLMLVYWWASYGFERVISCSDIQYAARQSREKIVKDLLDSEDLAVRTRDGSSVPPGEVGQCLYLEKEEEVQQVKVPCRVFYFKENNQLYKETRRLDNNVFIVKLPIAENVRDIYFSNPAPGLVNIRIEAASGDNVFSLETSCKKRID